MVGREGYIAVYLLTNFKYGTLYTGVTGNLARRMWEHREGVYPGFTKRYGLKRLVWYEPHESIIVAIQRERSMKKYRRDWKINLLERDNPNWDDLYPQLFGSDRFPEWPGEDQIP